MTIEPRFISPREWTDIVGAEIERRFRAIIPRMEKGFGWRDWARVVVDMPEISTLSPPRPEEHETFEDWARVFNNAVSY